jgi:hypothetical protein
MKITVGRLLLVAAVTCLLTPLFSVAQNFTSQVGKVNRDVERFTLLTGPSLLSPPHGAAPVSRNTKGAASIKLGAAPTFRFVPEDAAHPGKLPAFVETIRPRRPASAPEPSGPPSPESLRFEATVPATPVSLPTEAKPAPKRD